MTDRVLRVELLGKGERVGVGRKLWWLAAAKAVDKRRELHGGPSNGEANQSRCLHVSIDLLDQSTRIPRAG